MQGMWGWKGPRSIYYLPVFQRIFQGRFRYIHVIRDGRDVARGDNQMQFNSNCKWLGLCPSAQPKKSSRADLRLEFWARLNRDVYNYGKQVLNSSTYFALRIEDLALGDPRPTLRKLAKFLGRPEPRGAELDRLAELCSGHAKSYGGGKYTAAERAGHMKEFQASRRGIETLRNLGYKTNDWGLEPGWEPPARLAETKAEAI